MATRKRAYRRAYVNRPALEQAIAALTEKEQHVIEGYSTGKKLIDMGHELGLSRERVRQIIYKAIHKCREYIQKLGAATQ